MHIGVALAAPQQWVRPSGLDSSSLTVSR